MSQSRAVEPNARDQFWLERMRREEKHKLTSVYKGISENRVSSIPVSDKFAKEIHKMNPKGSDFIPSAVNTEYFKKNKFEKKDVFGRSLKMQKGKAAPTEVNRGKKCYYGEDKLSYMDRAVDLSQPDYKRFRLGKNASQVLNKFSKRNNSIEPLKKGTFVSLKHPYQWEIKPKKSVKYSFIRDIKDASDKVNNSSFENSIYKENMVKNNPINKGKEIAERLNYMKKDDLNNSAFMNTKYLKNFSTLNNQDSPLKTVYKRNPVLYDPKSMTDFYKNKSGKKQDVSPKVGQSFSNGEIPVQNYSPQRQHYLSKIQYTSPSK